MKTETEIKTKAKEIALALKKWRCKKAVLTFDPQDNTTTFVNGRGNNIGVNPWKDSTVEDVKALFEELNENHIFLVRGILAY